MKLSMQQRDALLEELRHEDGNAGTASDTTDANLGNFQPGDRVTWTQPTATWWILGPNPAAIVTKIGKKHLQIEAPYKPAYSRSTLFERARLWVAPASLAARPIPCAALGEPMTIDAQGLKITAIKRANAGAFKSMPFGVFYGAIDGHEQGSPRQSEEHALHDAYTRLHSGQYRTHLLAAIAQEWERILRHGPTSNQGQAAAASIQANEARLRKLDVAFPRAEAATLADMSIASADAPHEGDTSLAWRDRPHG